MEDFIKLASRPPWWLGLALAVVSYLVLLHPITTAPLPTPNVSASVSAVLIRIDPGDARRDRWFWTVPRSFSR